MTDESKKKSDKSTPGPVAGEKLAEARRLRQISLPDIARELHLDEPKVQAIEENRFDVLGAPVFAKGHLRKYADIVGVSIDDIMADYYTLNRATGAPPVVGVRREEVRDFRLSPWVLYLPLLLIAAALVYWWLGRSPAEGDTAQPANAQQALPARQQEQQPATDDSPPETAAATPPPEADEPDSPVAEPQAAPENAPARTPAAELATGAVRLTLSYSGDCWTEVTDGNGERRFFDLGSAGRTVNIAGNPPLRVLLGNSDNVSLQVNGRPYSIAAGDRRGETARLTISGSAAP